MSGRLTELDPHDADAVRWAFLNPETGDWIEVKPGTVALAASERPPVDPLREAAYATFRDAFSDAMLAERIDALAAVRVWDAIADLFRAALSPAAPRPEGLDVERLTSALNAVYLRHSEIDWEYVPVHDFAAAIFAEYARLSDTEDTP